MALFTCLSFLFSIVLSKELTNLEIIANEYTCDVGCWFNESEINSTTISMWPVNCSTVCGQLFFYSSSDVTIFELTDIFKNLRIFKGMLAVESTQYINLDFLSTLEAVYCIRYFSIGTNLFLTDLDSFNISNITCGVDIYKNDRLDLTKFCEKHEHLTTITSYENLKNCAACAGGRIDVDSVKKYVNCTAINGYLVDITDIFVTYGTDMSPLKDVENITASLSVFWTDAKDLRFLKKVKRIVSNKVYDFDINLHENYNLTRFGMAKLETLQTDREHFLINMAKLHPEFCLTTKEIDVFMRNNVQFESLEAKYCEDESRKNVCEFHGMNNLTNGCTGLLGKVQIGSGDEALVNKLENVTSVYGSLSIQNTTLENLSFLKSLEYVVLLNDNSTSLQVNYNKNLKSRSFSKGSKYQISFQENSFELLNSSSCLEFLDQLSFTSVVVNGKECEVIDRANGTIVQENGKRKNQWLTVALLVSVAVSQFC